MRVDANLPNSEEVTEALGKYFVTGYKSRRFYETGKLFSLHGHVI